MSQDIKEHKSSSAGLNMLDPHKLTRKLIVFAIPIIACGLVQQSFNAVDIAVVGKYVGHEALAAVGANGPVIGLIINLFMGLSLGANVIIANMIGQRNYQGVSKAVATSASLALASGLIMMLLGYFVAKEILAMLDTPVEIIDNATQYLQLISLGFPGMMIFNFGSAILRSIGDTKRPFYCLVVGGVVNVALNLFTVLVMDMGVKGVAISTVISNYISGLGVVILLVKEKGYIHLDIKKIKFYYSELSKIIRIGLPAGIQGMVFALSNVFIQSAINSFGPATVSGSATAITFEFYNYFFITAFTQAALAFISQNYGAGQYDVCRRVFHRCLYLSMIGCGVVNMIIVLLHPYAIDIFTSDPVVAEKATIRIFNVLMFQFIACGYEISGGAIRALGYSVTPMIITIFGTCLLRIAWVSTSMWHDFGQLLYIYPVSWLLTSVLMFVAYRVISRKVLHKAVAA